MKKIILMAFFTMLSIGSFAQEGQFAVGADLLYGSKINTIGIGAKAWYGLTDNLRGQLSYNDYFNHKGINSWDINLDGHYLLGISDRLKIYPIVGLNFLHQKVEIDSSIPGSETLASNNKSYLGLNLGGGLQNALSEHVAFNLEVKYMIIKSTSQVVVSAGLAYIF